MQFEQRFSGLQRDPNYFGFELMVLLVGYTVLFFKHQLKYKTLIPFGIISIIAIFTLSKSFLISYVLYLVVLLVCLLRYILKQIKDKKKKVTFICLIVTGVVICSIVAIIVLPKLFEGRANVVDTKSGGVYNFINSLTTGRLGIWIDYIKLYFKSFWRVVFGYGSLNGYPMDAVHNTPLQILFFGGIIALGILIYLLIKFIKNHKCPAIMYILIGILLIHSCSVDLLFSYRTYLILSIMILCFNLYPKEEFININTLQKFNTTKLSVVIPIYNAEKYIERCVESLTKHKDLNLEIILVNDGSTDNSGHICKQLALLDDRVNVIEKSNGGVSSARNEGLKYATGEYVTFIDADDFVSDEFKACYSVLGESEIYCVPYCEIKGDNKRLIIPTTDWNGKVATNLNNGAVTTGLYNSVCMKIFKTSIIKENNIEFDTSLKIAEDFKFVIDCFKVSNTIDFVGCCYYNYFRNDTSAMHKVDFEKICNTLDACKYAINTVKNIKSVNIKKLCLKLVSENLLSVFARVNDYSSDKNKYLMEELCKLKQYFSYGSSLIKKILVILIKIFGIKIFIKTLKKVKSIKRSKNENISKMD
ncbi:MAG: glycosyltransferase [Clostridia bacterium]|nr:glycosyltransferase [Clostridia bacterium]